MTDLLTPADLASELMRLSRLLDEAHTESVQRAHAYAEAEYAHDIAWSTARIAGEKADNSVEAKKAMAVQATADRKRAMNLAEMLRQSARDAEHNLRQQLSALMTVAASVRTEMEFAGKQYEDHRAPHPADAY